MKKIKILIVLLIPVMFSISVMAGDGLHERIYVQTDKCVYVAGEEILMKLITTDNKTVPSTVSAVAYVELLGADNIPVVQQKTALDKGVGLSRLQLPATTASGYYNLVAYTRFMKNGGEEIFFRKQLVVINPFAEENTRISHEELGYFPGHGNGNLGVVVAGGRIGQNSDAIMTVEGLPDNISTLSVSIAGCDYNIERSANSPAEMNFTQWQSLLPTGSKAPLLGPYTPERSGMTVDGRLVDNRTGEPADNTRINPLLTFVGDRLDVFVGLMGEDGNIQFNLPPAEGRLEVATAAFNAGDASYRIDLASPYARHTFPSPSGKIILNREWFPSLQDRSIAVQLHYLTGSLNQDEQKYNAALQPLQTWQPNKVYRLADYTRFTTMKETLSEFVSEVRLSGRGDNQRIQIIARDMIDYRINQPLLLLDGVPIEDHNTILGYDPRLVEEIKVYVDKFNLGGLVFDGVACFNTVSGDLPGIDLDRTVQIVDFVGLEPKYEYSVPVPSASEFSHTLLWNPEVKTTGPRLEIPFTTSEITGPFKAVVEGLCSDGKALYGEYIFMVE